MNAFIRSPFLGRKWFWIILLSSSLLAIMLLEKSWREMGYTPNIIDNKALWSESRAAIYQDDGRKVLVLVGASRIQTNISIDEMERMLPDYRVVQLAINGHHPLAVLRDLANDERFTGTVLLSTWPRGLPKAKHDDQQPWVDYYHREWNLDKALNRRISTFFQARFAIIFPATNLLKMAQNLAGGALPPRLPHVQTLPTREVRTNYSNINIKKYRQHRENRVKKFYTSHETPTPEQWREDAGPLIEWSHKIRQRGGDVLLIRMPTTGRTWKLDQQYYPKPEYWDRLAADFPGSSLHFADSNRLKSFKCPDTSHLDYRDVPRFTRVLVEELRHRGSGI